MIPHPVSHHLRMPFTWRFQEEEMKMEQCSTASLVIQGPPVAPAQQCSGLSSQCQYPAKAPSEKPSWGTDKFLYHFSLSTLCGSFGCPGSPSLYLDKHPSFSCLWYSAIDFVQLSLLSTLSPGIPAKDRKMQWECGGNSLKFLFLMLMFTSTPFSCWWDIPTQQ